MPWQNYALEEMLRCDENGRLLKKRVGLIISRQNGKSFLMTIRILAGMYLWGERWVTMAQNLDVTEGFMRDAVRIAKAVPELEAEIARTSFTNGKFIFELKNGGSWTPVAATKEGARGKTGNLWIDELREITLDAYKAATPITTTGNKQVIITSNAGDDYSEVLNDFRLKALTQKNKNVALLEWSSGSEDPGDRSGWAQANPALGELIDMDTLELAYQSMTTEGFMTEHLCRWVSVLDSPWVSGSFENCGDATLTLEPGKPTVLALDCTPDRRRADLVGGQLLDDGRIAFSIMQTFGTDGALDDMFIASEVAKWARTYNAEVIAFDKWTAANVAARLASARFPVVDYSGGTFAQGCDEALSAMNSGRLVHNSSEDLISHFNGCARKSTADGAWRVVRKGSTQYISAACASIMVIHHLSKPRRVAQIYSA